ncbi:MAG TPA: hypothetical protein P5509_01485 [Bacteroidales bacterium]|nr:hypothetical protein [Bacteroidales bacterium]
MKKKCLIHKWEFEPKDSEINIRGRRRPTTFIIRACTKCSKRQRPALYSFVSEKRWKEFVNVEPHPYHKKYKDSNYMLGNGETFKTETLYDAVDDSPSDYASARTFWNVKTRKSNNLNKSKKKSLWKRILELKTA